MAARRIVALVLAAIVAFAGAAAPRKATVGATSSSAAAKGQKVAKAALAKRAGKENILMQVYSDLTPGAAKFKVTKKPRREAPPCIPDGDDACPGHDDISLR
mmetsp:Transcript_105155/g.302360  ORF Transcript_105155/g.302360 Transcript_105155/m.302360 type:complete len:102 (-) Transcript_105155:129-434(-)|eukprot:CAMPEP_0177216624 /NCGR_PEP_ID=MMETSP0367-20130122/34855_1 /TAXON_ID=447022 ORGANISM="Scrippsiella hangoei-like, Strain SHHI-4" /NCGR_SAMPLE_ID=MMETSP0367 /ASSEMBLY_ACC=CAM_ASM_000362 /LENGTH=101 /DNA_ID=CAMNT_0018666149 /DNA_START=63 /DNA_END=368 /DNA_ORIENTATION=+